MKKIITIFLMGTTLFSASAQNNSDNPLLKKWTGPYGGVPAFNEYKVSDFKPAIQFAIQEKLSEIDAITNNPKAPTFDNTIAAL
ncbi:MAG: M3 family peptidase, partial [Flavobacterium sp.]